MSIATARGIATARDSGPRELNALYLLGCVILWRKTADMNAGWEVICALASPDPHIRQLMAGILGKHSPAFSPVAIQGIT